MTAYSVNFIRKFNDQDYAFDIMVESDKILLGDVLREKYSSELKFVDIDAETLALDLYETLSNNFYGGYISVKVSDVVNPDNPDRELFTWTITKSKKSSRDDRTALNQIWLPIKEKE